MKYHSSDNECRLLFTIYIYNIIQWAIQNSQFIFPLFMFEAFDGTSNSTFDPHLELLQTSTPPTSVTNKMPSSNWKNESSSPNFGARSIRRYEQGSGEKFCIRRWIDAAGGLSRVAELIIHHLANDSIGQSNIARIFEDWRGFLRQRLRNVTW